MAKRNTVDTLAAPIYEGDEELTDHSWRLARWLRLTRAGMIRQVVEAAYQKEKRKRERKGRG